MTEAQRAQFFAMRKALDGFVAKVADSPAEINENPAAIRIWHEGAYSIGDVRMYEGIPYKCVQAHDSTGNSAWNPTVASLWMQYHGTTPETARAFVQPTGAHDMYLKGEYMIWTDGTVKRATQDTAYGPDVWPDAWEDA